MKIQLRHLSIAAFALLLSGCASSSIKQSWKSPGYQGDPPKAIAIVAVADRGNVRAGIENRFVRDLHASGQDSTATYELLALPAIKEDKEGAAARFRAAGADAVLIVRLVDQATYSRTVQATPEHFVPTVTGYGAYGWYDAYSVAFMDMGTTWGSYKQNIYLDSSLFDLKTGQRLWSALTLTVLKEDADRLAVVDALLVKVVAAMRKDGLAR
jgi:hypothetical protein